MRQLARRLILGLIAALMANGATIAQPNFVPPRAVSASDLTYPETIVSGLVLLSVSLDRAGHLTGIETLRDVPSATARSLIAAQNWQFASASLDGQAVDSSLTLHLLFNPANVTSRRVDLNGLDLNASLPIGASAPNNQYYVPPHVKFAVFASDPATTLTSGPVALDVRVDRTGRVRRAWAIFTSSRSLTNAAISAAKKWRFTPGSLHGAPIESDTVVVFVFRPPTIATTPGSAPVPLPNR